MRICTVSALKNKEIINLSDGKRLGFACDVEIDLECGRIVSILVPADGRLFGSRKCEPMRILWCEIERIGDDVILVRSECSCADDKPKKC